MDTPELIEQARRSEALWSIDQVIEIACLAGRDTIGSLHVDTSRRPTFAELLRYRQLATACGFTLTLTGSGVVLRPVARARRGVGGQGGLRARLAQLRNRALRQWPGRPASTL